MTYLEAAELVARERETEQWLRSQDWSDIVMRIHELEDLVAGLDVKLEKAVKALGDLVDLNEDFTPFGGEMFQDRVVRVWENARTTLAEIKGEDA